MAQAYCIVGPTASGKSALALALAFYLPIEIINVDSALIYRGMDIGTAKPSASELATVPHHGINILDPTESYSAARFVADTVPLIAAIRQRARIPLLVGGTLLYVKALREGLADLPSADANVRQRVHALAEQQGWPALHQQLAVIDPSTAQRLAVHDRQRIGRALEVYFQTGRTLSSYFAQQTQHRPDAPQYPILSLEPADDAGRSVLHQRIAQRFSAMLEQGLIAEVEQVFDHCGRQVDLPAMRCVGYRQVIDSLLGQAPWETLFERGAAATRQLAKRQLTWLRSMTRHPLDFTLAPSALAEQALHWIQQHEAQRNLAP